MKVGFIGSVAFSANILSFLLEKEVNIAGVITKNEKGINADHTSLEEICKTNDVVFRLADGDIDDEQIEWLKSLDLDLIFCFGWSHILPTEVIEIPRKGILGYHPSLLPKNRGRHPLIWALCLGLNETGSTIFSMDRSADSGPIVSQKKIPITYEDDAASLYEKMTRTAIGQLEELLPTLQAGKLPQRPQDNEKANNWRKRSILDGKIDFRMHSTAIYNLVRALTRPYEGAHFEISSEMVKVWKIKELKDNPENIEPGKILSILKNGFIVKCFEGSVLIEDYDANFTPVIGKYIR